MKKASMKANVKGLKFEVKMSMDSCEIKNNRHIVGNKDYDEGNRVIKGFKRFKRRNKRKLKNIYK